MTVTYLEVEGGSTQTDLNVEFEEMTLCMEMKYYQSESHSIQRLPEESNEKILLYSDLADDTYVSVYLVEDPIFEKVEQEYISYVQKTNARGEKVIEPETKYMEVEMMVRNPGTFIVDMYRPQIDQPYKIENPVMNICNFMIPKGFKGKLTDLNIQVIKVV